MQQCQAWKVSKGAEPCSWGPCTWGAALPAGDTGKPHQLNITAVLHPSLGTISSWISSPAYSSQGILGQAAETAVPPQWSCHLKEMQLEAGLHTHLWILVLPKSKSGCMCIYQIAGTKKKFTFLLPVFLAFNLLYLLSAEGCRGAAEAVGQVAGLRLPWESIACVRRAVRVSGQQASVQKPERGDWNVKRKRVHGNSELSPDEKQRERDQWDLPLWPRCSVGVHMSC
ncbi:uncharacterized protein LOC130596847 [Pezoporus wallicus]|uniref:uncharacterized protein LOC130596847 n=1 Tax=Pezoporus wallicus TaxID=35540 RepID=UPI00254C481F|nr:uncharacterized protein LOC130596847 [Pezoporus wallicus]